MNWRCSFSCRQDSSLNRSLRYTGSFKGSAQVDFYAIFNQLTGSGASINAKSFAAIVVSSFSAMALPAPTKNPANNNVTRNIVLREYVGIAQGRCGSSNSNIRRNKGNIHIAGFF